ncbi:hypothetical protein BpHYR1_013050 [Brachionus plicatilis]|uniref:RNA-directed DNA polymerase from mobile element jockey-like n=1 Tax=Brachionus plicatilis TaxID=10195 RepID=A0A3M7PQ59_BRAPC|nr:hypothetical protein BpHYR1_013050 [Brachionus plicatilis]
MYGLKCLVSIVGQKQKCYFYDEEGHNLAKCPIKETLFEKCHQKRHLTQKCSIAEKLKSLERKKIEYNDLYIDQEETQSIIGADQKDNYENMMPKTPGYQPTNFNDVISQISTQDPKTPVLEDHLVSRLNDFLPLCQSPVNVPSNDQNETETFFQTKNQIKRFSESDPNEKEFTEKESKKPLVVLENENDNTFDSESNSSTTECSIQVDQSSNEDEQKLLINKVSEANIYLDFHNYQFITKPRNKYGGGVAILIKEIIEFIQDFSYEEFNSELLCIKINLGKNSELFVFSLYNPPNVLLNFEFFKTVNKKCRNYILGGDLNARTKQIGCVGENENGIMLERMS